MRTLFQDLRYGARMLRQQMGFTLVAILTMALGIAVNTAIFSVIDAVMLKPLPYPNQARLVAIGETVKENPNGLDALSYPDAQDYRAQTSEFERVAVYALRGLALTSPDGAVRLRGALVGSDLFQALGVNPVLGRHFLPSEDKAAGGRAVMLSHRLWQNRFKGDQDIVGRTVPVNGEPYTIVGVMPPGFQFPIQAEPVELWTNYAKDCEDNGANSTCTQRGNRYLSAIGLLKPGSQISAAEAQMNHVSAQIEKQFPNDHRGITMRALPLINTLVGDISAALWVIFGAVICVMLIACANVASLMLARAAKRQREFAVRMSLGAGRWRVIRQMLTESLLLALLGGVTGVVLASFMLEALIALTPDVLPRVAEAELDWRVLFFTLGITLLTGLLVGLMPAWQVTKTDLYVTLKAGGRNATGAPTLARRALIVAEVAISVVLLVSAGLLMQSFARLSRVETGLQSQHLVTMRVALPDGIYQKADQIAAFYQRLMNAVEELPGISAHGVVTPLPLTNGAIGVGFNIEGRPNSSGVDHPYDARFALVSAAYFKTMGVAIRQGREFEARDDRKAVPAVVINEAFAKKFFPHENPLGKRIDPTIQAEDGPLPMREIIGVVADYHANNPAVAPEPELYLHIPQMPALNVFSLVLRTPAEPPSVFRQVREIVARLDQNVPVSQAKLLDEYLSDSIAEPCFNSWLLSLFAALALLLTVIGLYGVIAYSVSQRTQELGVRMALGAHTTDILRLVIGQGMRLVLLGTAAGLLGAFVVTRWLQSLLFQVGATDPLTFALVTGLLLLVTLLAAFLPAYRATRVDPLVALRCE